MSPSYIDAFLVLYRRLDYLQFYVCPSFWQSVFLPDRQFMCLAICVCLFPVPSITSLILCAQAVVTNLNSKLLNKMGHYFLDIKYVLFNFESTLWIILACRNMCVTFALHWCTIILLSANGVANLDQLGINSCFNLYQFVKMINNVSLICICVMFYSFSL